LIEVKNLVKKYGSKYAVDHISFTVNKGEILGFLGPNGAGKSTTLNIITGFLSSTSGDAFVDGINVLDEPEKAKRKIGFLPEQPPLYLEMTVKEYLNFVCDIKGVKTDRKSHISDICELVKISHVYNRIIKNLSKGYRQRVGVAQSLVGNPEILILDEPTVGLDPRQIIDIRNLIMDLGKQHTIILSSHILSEVQATCSRVIVINEGKLLADDTPENLSKNLSTDNRIVVRIKGSMNEISDILNEIPGIISVELLGEREIGAFDYIVEAERGTDIRETLFIAMAQSELPILSMKNSELTLEDIFLKLIGNAGKEVV